MNYEISSNRIKKTYQERFMKFTIGIIVFSKHRKSRQKSLFRVTEIKSSLPPSFIILFFKTLNCYEIWYNHWLSCHILITLHPIQSKKRKTASFVKKLSTKRISSNTYHQQQIIPPNLFSRGIKLNTPANISFSVSHA